MTQARNLSRLLNKKMNTYKYTATAGQTSFTDSDDAGLVLSYAPDNLMVTYNGVVLENGSEYTASNGSSIVLTEAADSAAEVNVYAFETISYGGYLSTTTGGTVAGDIDITGRLLSRGNELALSDGVSNYLKTADKLYFQTDATTHGVVTNTGDFVVGGTAAINSSKLSVDAGTGKNGLSIDVDAPSGFVGISIDRTAGAGDVMSFKVGGTDKGHITTSADGTSFRTQSTPSTSVNTLDQNSFLLKNSGNLTVSGDYNDTSLRNSVFYQVGSPANKAHVNNGVGMYISTYGMGATHDNATDERAAQMYFGDTRDAGMYARVKQGTSGWHDWVKIQNDFAYKEGPNAYQSDYRVTWHYGGHWGSSMDATSATDGIIINETGIYIAQMAQRCNANNAMIGLAVNGDRSSYEMLSNSMWGHDHSGSTSGEWSHSIFAGELQAGWKITGGPPSTYSSSVPYSDRGYNGWIIIQRIA